jgi:drug/metabolite transporter (DMT)-like permease
MAALLLGGVSYGISLVLFLLALRRLGAARTGAYFAAAPFYAAALSLLVFWSAPDLRLLGAALCVLVALVLLAGERHIHTHRHGELVHSHWHAPDPEHRHPHGESAG